MTAAWTQPGGPELGDDYLEFPRGSRLLRAGQPVVRRGRQEMIPCDQCEFFDKTGALLMSLENEPSGWLASVERDEG